MLLAAPVPAQSLGHSQALLSPFLLNSLTVQCSTQSFSKGWRPPTLPGAWPMHQVPQRPWCLSILTQQGLVLAESRAEGASLRPLNPNLFCCSRSLLLKNLPSSPQSGSCFVLFCLSVLLLRVGVGGRQKNNNNPAPG